MILFWFRRDLRLEDNAALFQALSSGEEVLPVFIFDTEILSELPPDDARVNFIHDLLEKMQAQLREQKRSLAVFFGKPEAVLARFIGENEITAVYANHDYEPYARQRDKAINALLKEKGIAFKTCKDQVIFEKSEIAKDSSEPYVVYTPYANKWLQNFDGMALPDHPSEALLSKLTVHPYPFLSLEEIGFKPSEVKVPAFDITHTLIADYQATRDFPALDGTSKLGPYLRFGAVSIRRIAEKARQEHNKTFLKELIWREFFMQILWHFPHTASKSFKPQYDRIKWRNNEKEFENWCQGKTGYPFVDAGMRELNATGRMHNRVRMVTASFLCKHLLIDWRWGEAYFAGKLLDYEQSSNVGNWQWAAGSGVDAAPYFRIFNPSEQIKKFDKDGKYLKKWLPEWGTDAYPEPIVDHKEARERCLKVYKEALF